MSDEAVLLLSCPDQAGIVATVTTELFRTGANVLEAHQYGDPQTLHLFMRVRFSLGADTTIDDVSKGLAKIAARFDMRWSLLPTTQRQRVMLLVSRFDHCLGDLLYRWRTGELPMEIVGIIANYPRETYARLNLDGIPFHYLPVSKDTKPQQEDQLWQLIEAARTDLVVLARYMQVLSEGLVAKLQGRCINIHHSFLPGFKGAKPYHQAHARGVKLIGATAHYVTSDLDEGPIIEQDVERISHQDSPDSLLRKGREIEQRVLARAIAWHLASRVMPNGTRTVVFRD